MMLSDSSLIKTYMSRYSNTLEKDINKELKKLFMPIFMDSTLQDSKQENHNFSIGNLTNLNLRLTLQFRFSLELSDYQIRETIGSHKLEGGRISNLMK